MILDFTQIKSFVVTNGILIAIAGYTIGHATADLIKAFVVNVLMPLIYYVFVKHLLRAISYDGYINVGRLFVGSKRFDIEELMKEFIAWALTCVLAYVLIAYLLKTIFANTSVTQEKESYKFI